MLALAAALSTAPSARATLIGDTINLDHYFDALHIEGHSVTVQAGTTDLVMFGVGPYNVNPEADAITVNFLANSGFGNMATSTFNGLRITGIDEIIDTLSITTNMANWDVSRLAFDQHSISVNWVGLFSTPDTVFPMTINPPRLPGATVPEGGATAGLLG